MLLFSERQEEESRNVKITVWWDIDSCKLPSGFDICKVAPSLTAALRANGLKGPIQMTMFGDLRSLDRANWDKWRSSGIGFKIFPKEATTRDYARKAMFWEILQWVDWNLPPAHLFFICGGNYFADLLKELRMRKYNILLASNYATAELCSAATIMWHWNSLTSRMCDWKSMLTGENFIGKHLNEPPDSPSGSWYGYLEVPIKNPSSTSTPDLKVLSPKSPLNEIQHIVKSYPEGMSYDRLLSKLAKVDWKFGKKYFELPLFVRFLLSFSHIFQVVTWDDGRSLVSLVTIEPTAMPSILSGGNSKAEESLSPPKLGAETESTNRDYGLVCPAVDFAKRQFKWTQRHF